MCRLSSGVSLEKESLVALHLKRLIMFASLNRFIARLDSEPQGAPSQRGIYGFQVLRHTNAELAIEPWFDFVVGINGHAIVCDPGYARVMLPI